MPQEPQAFIRSRGDAIIILLLWCTRSLSLVLLFVGVIVLIVTQQFSEDLSTKIDTPADILNSLTSPLAGVALAVVVRVASAGVAWLSAAPLVARDDPPLVPTADQPAWHQVTDRWRQISGAASVRRTWTVRSAAITMTGTWGDRLRLADITLRVLAVVSAVAMLVIGILNG